MRHQLRVSWIICLIVVVSGSSAGVAEAVTFRTMVLSGQAAVGTSEGVKFSDFGIPAINNAGQTAFRADILGTGIDATNDSGIWSEGGGSLHLVARAGSAAPGTAAGVNFAGCGNLDIGCSEFSDPTINNGGHTAFTAGLKGTGVNSLNDYGGWSEGGGSLHLVARNGSAAPGTPPGTVFTNDVLTNSPFYSLRPLLNDFGQSVWGGVLSGPGVSFQDAGIWSEFGGNSRLVVRDGSAAPEETGAGVFFDGIGLVGLSNLGQTVFVASLGGSGVDDTNDDGIWLEENGSIRQLLRSGSAAPGTDVGVRFSSFVGPSTNGAGQIAMYAVLAGPGVDSTNDIGIWSEGGGGLDIVAREGSAAPGMPDGVKFSNFTFPLFNDLGQTAFHAGVSGPGVDDANNQGIWSDSRGTLHLVAREGSAAPGTGPGVHFSGFRVGPGFFATPMLNGVGQTAFMARLSGDDVNSTNDDGIWAEGASGLELMAREGDLLEVSPGDKRTISGLELHIPTGKEKSGWSGFNDFGQLAFYASFRDGTSGIFVADVGTIPEPSTVLLFCAGLIELFGRGLRTAADRF